MATETNSYRPHGMRGLFIIWLGQMVAGIATSTTFYALPFWISEKTGASGTALAAWESFFFAAYLGFVLFALFFIDRYPRKAMMLAYDFLLLSATAVLLVMEASGTLQVWHIYLNAIVQGVGYAFRLPTYSSVITILVPRREYVRANGMLSLLYDTPEIFGPVLAGLLYLTFGLKGILAINLISFVFSIGALLFVEIPPTPHTDEGERSHAGFFKAAMYGIGYILRRPGLLGIQLIFFLGNIFSGIALSVTALYTMVTLRTGGNVELAGSIQSAGAVAAVVAGLLLSIFGGINRPVRAILIGWILSSLFGLTLLGIGQIFMIWMIAKVIDSLFSPVVDVAINKFIQMKVPPDIQGRIFAASDFIAQVPFLFTPFLAGYFGDKVFEPAMRAGGAWVHVFGWLVGTGPGAGYGLMIFLCGIGGTLVGLWGYIIPSIRNAEQTMPDIVLPPPVGLVRRERSLSAHESSQPTEKRQPAKRPPRKSTRASRSASARPRKRPKK
jgi:DHA3 family macrolide efflux protein-like MFS transporter